jgi:uncharacterized protein (TIGR02594 family)
VTLDTAAPHEITSVVSAPAADGGPPWMAIARAEAGVRTAPPGASNPRITAYHAGTNIAGYDDKAAWCSSFADWCLRQVGVPGTGSALARSWLAWGEALAEPRPGCIVVLTRDPARPWTGHVGFFLRRERDELVLFGGNQLDCVCENRYPVTQLLGYRWPAASDAPQETP